VTGITFELDFKALHNFKLTGDSIMANGSNSTNPTVYPASNLRYVDPHMRLIKFIPDKTQATFPEFITAPTYVPNKGTANSISAFFSP